MVVKAGEVEMEVPVEMAEKGAMVLVAPLNFFRLIWT